jgi:hypothetical protein
MVAINTHCIGNMYRYSYVATCERMHHSLREIWEIGWKMVDREFSPDLKHAERVLVPGCFLIYYSTILGVSPLD